MTEEYPIRPKSDYQPHNPSEEDGLVEEFDENHNPEYLLEEDEESKGFSAQLDFGYFFNQNEIYDL